MCPCNCIACDESMMCQSCKQGYLGKSCMHPCGDGCLNSTCGFDTSECQCKDGFYTAYCNAMCSPYCQDVCDNTTGACRCKPGYSAATCTRRCPKFCTECTDETSCSAFRKIYLDMSTEM
ncbi:hypothetical protein DPMN_021506 [Dreissena polymorpha]|uniref:EGF-like domain-containing protein n=1 Tax=Dreissena polymorpha TaxID=45954 RepID=A0A9D4NIP3_DREPO|nr:hypothetical protein DPMN_021506 [Dreissena polymorpha]